MSEQLAALDAETRRLRASEQLSELGEVGRGLAHSLRNPLNALGLALDQLAERAAAGEGTGAGATIAERGTQPETDSDSAAIAASARRQIRRIDAALRGFLALSAADAASSNRCIRNRVIDFATNAWRLGAMEMAFSAAASASSYLPESIKGGTSKALSGPL